MKVDTNPLHNVSAIVLLLNNLLQKMSIYTQHMDIQSNVIVAIGTAVFVFSGSFFRTGSHISWPLLVLTVFSALAVLTALLAINPPNFMRKKGQKESLFYQVKVSRYTSPEEYYKDLREIVSNEEKIIEEVAKEVYNIAHYSYRPKRFFFDLARNLLALGFLLSFIIFLYQTFLKPL